MNDTLIRWLEGIPAAKTRYAILNIAQPSIDRLSTQSLISAGMVITSAGATTAKTGTADWYGVANAVLVKVTAATTLPALVGTILAGGFNVWCFFVDSAGVVTSAAGTQGTTLAKVVFPVPPKNKALLGTLIVTYASAFTGGTTPLDTATTVYINNIGAFDPSARTG